MNIEADIEFKEIKQRIINYCHTQSAKNLVEKLHLLKDFEQIQKLLRQSYQMKMMLLSLKPFVNDGYIDMRDCLKTLNIKDSFIELDDMPMLLDSMKAIKNIFAFLDTYNDSDISEIKKIKGDNIINENLIKELELIIDEKGEIKESYSPVLRQIRIEKQKKISQIERQINSILAKSKKEGWSNDEDEVSIRNNSLTIPVKATYKRQIKGILHASSGTGQTYYIEPEIIVELNFDIKELYFKEKEEIHKILLNYSNMIRDNLDSLIACYDFLVEMDFLKAKADYAIKTSSTMPQMCNYPIISWYDARHPLLEEVLQKKKKNIVPLHIELNEKQRILVISGPNAGGKSICLKTVALLQYMLQSGLLIPTKETSKAGVFENIFLSIGDEQSLEDELSTYSSHLLNMKSICEQVNKNTLFLVDELGAGTDPGVGGAIAEAILEYFDSAKSFGVITTHYSVLKHLAFEKESIVNAAMLFDTENIKPLYTLSIGNPGSSFAFELAEKAGLSQQIISSAKKKIGKQNLRFEQQLQQIAVNKLEVEKKLKSVKDYDDILYQTVQKYKELTEKIDTEKNKILNNAKNQAKDILLAANKQIEHTIEKIKTANADKQVVKQEKETIKTKIQELEKPIETKSTNEKPVELKKQNIKIINSPIQTGDYVIFLQTENIGKVVKISKKDYLVNVGDINIKTKLNLIAKIDKNSYSKQIKGNKAKDTSYSSQCPSIMNKVNQERINFKEQLDVRGYRTDEALKAVDKQLDTAYLIGEKTIKILHGKGDGILKTMIRDYLKHKTIVAAFYAEDIKFGGEGITIVELNI